MNHRYNKLIKNIFWNSGSFVFITLISFLLLPYIIKKLSVEGYGIYILITSLVGFYGMLDLGLGNALIKYVAELYELKENEKLNLYINSTVIFQGIIGIIALIVTLFFSKNILDILNISDEHLTEATTALKLCALGFFFNFISSAYSSVLQGLQLYKLTSLVGSFFNLVLNVLVAVVLYMGYGLIGSIIVNVVIAIVTFACYYILVKNRVPKYRLSIFIKIKALKEIIVFSLFIFLSKISAIISNYVVKFVISFFLGPTAVTYYTVPSKIVGAVGGIASSGLSSFFPFTSQLNARQSDREIKALFLKGSRIFIASVTPINIFICLFSYQILSIWMGRDFAEETWFVLSIISFSSYVGGFSAIPNLIILGKGNSKLIGLFSIFTIVLYAIFLPILTKLFGIIGTSFALLISSVGVIYYVIYKTTKIIEINIKEYYSIVLRPHIISFFLAICFYLLLQFLRQESPIIILGIGFLLIILNYFFLNKTQIFPIKNIIIQILQKT